VPAVFHAPPELFAKQWLGLYQRGLVVVVPLAIASTSAFSYLAYAASCKGGFWSSSTAQLYATAALLAVGNPAYTGLVTLPINNAITAITQGAGEQGVEKVVGLVRKWDGLNMTRGFIMLPATVLGTWLTASRPM
jgi:hypothetical protein